MMPLKASSLVLDEEKSMIAIYASGADAQNPLSMLKATRVPLPPVPPGWVRVKVTAAAINYHDIYTLQGVATHPLTYPRILGCECSGCLEDGTPVILYPVMGNAEYIGDETLDPERHVFHEITDGTLAEYVVAPRRNVLERPVTLDAVSGAVLGISWLTAYRMLFTKSQIQPGQLILVQGSSGGVSTALIQLGSAAGIRVWTTGRSTDKRKLATKLGAERTFAPGETLPRPVDAVFDTSGEPTWAHSMACVKPGGSIVTCGARGGFRASVDLLRVFNEQISIHGVYAGTLHEFRNLIDLVTAKRILPAIGEVAPVSKVKEAMMAVWEGRTMGKSVIKF